MPNWRDLNRKALADVHRQFQLPAVYLTHVGGSPVAVQVRLHRKIDQANGSGSDFSDGAEQAVLSDTIVFDAASVNGSILSAAFVIFSDREAYITGSCWPERRGYLRVEVAAMPLAKLADLLDSQNLTAPEWAAIFPAG